MSPDEPTPEPPPELIALFETFTEASKELFHLPKDADPCNIAEGRKRMHAYQTLLAKFVEDLRPFQEFDGMSADIAAFEATLAQMRDAYVPHELNAAELELQNLAIRLANRQGTQTPDFNALYRKKAMVDRKFMPGSAAPPRDRLSDPDP